MSRLGALLRDERGAAAEFALVLPLAMLLMFGIIDGGRYLLELSRAEKATQAGARIAAVTAMIPKGVADYRYAVEGGIPQGSPVPAPAFTGVSCSGTAAGVACNWLGTPTNAYALNPQAAAFTQIYERMRGFLPGLERQQVQVTYRNSGLGFAGDPTGPDVAPIITVSLTGRDFDPIVGLLTGPWGIPASPYSISQEDGSGTCFEEQTANGTAACNLG